MNDFRLSLPPAGTHAEPAVLTRLSDLVNEVYAEAEKGLWRAGATRTSAAEVAEMTLAGQIAVACLGEHIVGCVRIRPIDEHTAEFGMLTADPAHRGQGIGRDLVAFAERRALDSGRRVMRLELLTPRSWTHPSKEFLAGWYTRLGYERTGVNAVDDSYPALAPLLATPCDMVVYRKHLEEG
ncbi:GNAT family N-acetyltransferase [Nonomuraea sp. K274]|uniref:GNAT family N-acetyltransferase n=1 Tax=Nonomuraea cypriaca TaxID=1187855 RepID=A0A931F3K4_9ACTN|nr:GNAT family N-acetyltransferase [Nonomuraea cypriaca]MBF8190191.1 GNAT family N-acetyltransferase [Nonomuraea cypriaca]